LHVLTGYSPKHPPDQPIEIKIKIDSGGRAAAAQMVG
jgi:hypothetical protein